MKLRTGSAMQSMHHPARHALSLGRSFTTLPPLYDINNRSEMLHKVRLEERKSLLAMREQASEVIRRAESYRDHLGPIPSVPDLLKAPSGSKQFIPLGRIRAQTDIRNLSASAMDYARQIQQHALDLEQEGYKTWAPGDPDVLERHASVKAPDFVALEAEELTLKRQIQDLLRAEEDGFKDTERLVVAASNTGKTAARGSGLAAGIQAAQKHYRKMLQQKRGMVDDSAVTKASAKVPVAKEEVVAFKPNRNAAVPSTWDDLIKTVEGQMEQDEVAANKCKT